MNRQLWRMVPAALLAAVLSAPAAGDGCYVPTPAFPEMPRIPDQQALIVFRDGRETLFVQSGVSTDSPRVGWILPLPAVPDRLTEASPGPLKTLQLRLLPTLVHDEIAWLMWPAAAFLALALYFLGTRMREQRPPAIGLLVRILLLVVCLALLGAMLLPSLGHAGSGISTAEPGIRVHKELRSGAQELTVLSAGSPEDLDTWLLECGLRAMPDHARPLVADYIGAGWCFCVARLAGLEGGAGTPRPLKVEFATEEAVYPLRLTALAESEPYFELFVVGEQEAVCPLLEREFVDVFDRDVDARPDPLFFGRTYSATIGHPEVCELLWNGCVVTKLAGVIEPSAMTHDLTFRWRKPRPFRAVWFSRAGAGYTAGAGFAGGLLGVSVLGMILYRKRLKAPSDARFYAVKVQVFLTLALLFAAAAFYLHCPVVAVRPGLPRWAATMAQVRDFEQAIMHAVDRVPVQKPADKEGVLRAVRRSLSGINNPFSDGAMVEQASPGDYTLAIEGAELVATVYEHDGSPHRVRQRLGDLSAPARRAGKRPAADRRPAGGL